MTDHNSAKHARLATIQRNINIPENCEGGLPYLANEASASTTIIRNSSADLEVDKSVEAELTSTQQINWCRTIHPLYPLKTNRTENQFLSAVSLALWGFTEGACLLRRLLYVFVAEYGRPRLLEHWNMNKANTVQNTAEHDFQRFVEMTRDEPQFISLNEDLGQFPLPLHVFVTANILRRPIVVIGLEDDPIAGLYLPMLWRPSECTKWPLVLAVHRGQYYPLVNSEVPATAKKLAEFAVPLVSSNLQPLKMQFLLQSKEMEAHSLLQNYMKIIDLNLTRNSDICLILSAKLNHVLLENRELNHVPLENRELNHVPLENRETTTTPGTADDDEWTRMFHQVIGNGIVPSAPSASTLTLNTLVDVEPFPEEPREMSMLQETCHHPGCNNFASRFTTPFCWEHVGERVDPPMEQAGRRLDEGLEPVEISLVYERCQEPRCPNFASRFIYPYCYEHLDRKTVETMMTKKPPSSQPHTANSMVLERCNHSNCRNYASQYIYPFCYQHIDDREVNGATVLQNVLSNESNTKHEFEISMMPERCVHPTCENHSSKYTYPVCYEHLDSPLARNRATTATRVIQLSRPVERPGAAAGERVQSAGQPSSSSACVNPQVLEIDKKFEETMKELEARTRNSLARCANRGCNNFGNSRCHGYCHGCFKLVRIT